MKGKRDKKERRKEGRENVETELETLRGYSQPQRLFSGIDQPTEATGEEINNKKRKK